MSMFVGAQNLVPNGGFEEHNNLPSTSGQWYMASGWSSVNDGTEPTAPSPDYFHTAGSGEVQLPASAYASLSPHSGDAAMGFVGFSGDASNFREYISSPLAAAMTPGTIYTVSFWLSNGSSNRAAGSRCDNIGIQFSTTPLSQLSYFPITSADPQIVVPGKPWSEEWEYHSYQFIATEASAFITIGNFRDDANTGATISDPLALFPNTAYYFIDDIVIEEFVALPALAISGDHSLCSGEATNLTAIGPGPYTWAESLSPSIVLSNDTVLTTIPLQTTTYQLMSPSDTAVVTIVVQDCVQEIEVIYALEMPNVFTPNGDGVNDRFEATVLSGYSDSKMYVLDRWGGKVFSTEELLSGWDGNLNGDPCHEGVYFWVIEAIGKDGEVVRKQGMVTVLRK